MCYASPFLDHLHSQSELHRLLRLVLLLGVLCPLRRGTLQLPLARCLVLRTLGVHLVLELALTSLLGLSLVDLCDMSERHPKSRYYQVMMS